MPTAVERLAGLLRDVLKLDAIDGAAEQAVIVECDGSVDRGFAALQGAATPRAFAAAEQRFGHVFTDLGAAAFGTGVDLQRDAGVFGFLNAVTMGRRRRGRGEGLGEVHLWRHSTGSCSQAGGDLAKFGAHFAQLGHVESHDAFAVAESRFAPDLMRVERDFAALAGDVGGANGASPFAPIFSDLSADFAAIGRAFGDGGGAVFGAGFAAVNHDLLALDGAIPGDRDAARPSAAAGGARRLSGGTRSSLARSR